MCYLVNGSVGYLIGCREGASAGQYEAEIVGIPVGEHVGCTIIGDLVCDTGGNSFGTLAGSTAGSFVDNVVGSTL